METKTKTSYEDLMGMHADALAHLKQEERKLRDALYALEKDRDNEKKKLSRLNRIACMAGWGHNSMEWQKTLTKEKSMEHLKYRNELAWQEIWELRTSTLHFRIFLTERTDLKRDKWVVKLVLWKNTLDGEPHYINGGYRDTEYGKYKYGSELEKKFRSEIDATYAVSEWMDKLYEDHSVEIDADRQLRALCIKTGFKYDEDRRFY